MRFLLIQLTIYFLLNALKKFVIGKLFVLRKQNFIKDPVGNLNHSYFTFLRFILSSRHHCTIRKTIISKGATLGLRLSDVISSRNCLRPGFDCWAGNLVTMENWLWRFYVQCHFYAGDAVGLDNGLLSDDTFIYLVPASSRHKGLTGFPGGSQAIHQSSSDGKSWRHSQSTPSPPPLLPDNCNSGRLGARKGPHIILGGSVRVKCTDLQTMCTYLAQTARQIEWIFGEKTGFNAEESPQRATLWRRALPDAEDRFTKILLAGRGWHPLIVQEGEERRCKVAEIDADCQRWHDGHMPDDADADSSLERLHSWRSSV